MKKRYLFFIIAIILIIILVGIFLWKNKIIGIEIEQEGENISQEEVIPEEEISDEQLRTTTIKVFYANKDDELSEETRSIDVKELMNNPYEIIINYLIEGPNNSENIKLMPDGTELISSQMEGNLLKLNFNKAFIENCEQDYEKQELLINSILNSIVDLKEIDKIKILIEGEEIEAFSEDGYNLSEEISV